MVYRCAEETKEFILEVSQTFFLELELEVVNDYDTQVFIVLYHWNALYCFWIPFSLTFVCPRNEHTRFKFVNVELVLFKPLLSSR